MLGLDDLIAVFSRASAQMIVPADRTLHVPDMGWTLAGNGIAENGASIAHLKVEYLYRRLPETHYFVYRGPLF